MQMSINGKQIVDSTMIIQLIEKQSYNGQTKQPIKSIDKGQYHNQTNRKPTITDKITINQ